MSRLNKFAVVDYNNTKVHEHLTDAQEAAEQYMEDRNLKNGVAIAQIMLEGSTSRVLWDDGTIFAPIDRRNSRWTDADRANLARAYREFSGNIHRIAKRMGRSECAVIAQIERQLQYNA